MVDVYQAGAGTSHHMNVNEVLANRASELLGGRRGDPAAERELYDRHVDRVYRLVYRMAGDAEQAREFTQDAFVRAFERLATFRGESAFSTWLGSIAISVTLTGLKQRKRRWDREQDLALAEPVAGESSKIEPDLRRKLFEAIDVAMV